MDARDRSITEMNVAINDVSIVEVEPFLVAQIDAVCRGSSSLLSGPRYRSLCYYL
jgi:hypothetical protein